MDLEVSGLESRDSGLESRLRGDSLHASGDLGERRVEDEADDFAIPCIPRRRRRDEPTKLVQAVLIRDADVFTEGHNAEFVRKSRNNLIAREA